ncbi:MAG: hypothetical protein IJH12_01235 [Clostridia bacterium]|nr:hypothetical protein [Clostridia bacterium]
MDSTTILEIITKTINTLFQNLFSSIDNNIYAILDDITFINKDILQDNFTQKIIGNNPHSGLLLIANSLIIGFSIYYAIRYLFSEYSNSQVERPYQFIFKLIIISIFINSSYFICEKVIEINFYISGSIRWVGEHFSGENISFEQLIKKINNIFFINSTLNVFSFDGMIKSFTSIGLLNLLFSYSLRYIMIKVFILISPIMIITLLNSTTSWIFKSWMKSVFSLLFVQSLISIILIIIFSTDFLENNIFSKLIYIGSIYALIKANTYTAHIFGGIVTDINSNLVNIKKLIK